MTELRLTFPSEGFAAVSQLLVDMGLSFHVEPVGTTAKEDPAPAVEARPANKQTTAKSARKTSGKARARKAARSESAAPPPTEATVAGAERLRAAIARSGPATYQSPLEPPASTAEPAPPAAKTQPSEGDNS